MQQIFLTFVKQARKTWKILEENILTAKQNKKNCEAHCENSGFHYGYNLSNIWKCLNGR